jgi:hypothetical protein
LLLVAEAVAGKLVAAVEAAVVLEQALLLLLHPEHRTQLLLVQVGQVEQHRLLYLL